MRMGDEQTQHSPRRGGGHASCADLAGRSQEPMRQPTTRLLMIDHQRCFTESLSYRINSEEQDLDVIATATDTETGMRIVFDTKPEMVVFETELPGRGAFDAASDLSIRLKETKIVFLTGHLSDILIDQALRVRAGGYLLKSEPVEFVIQSLKRIAKGEFCFSKAVEERLEHDPLRNRFIFRSDTGLSSLTPRQLEVLRHLAEGYSVKEAAKRMLLSAKSVDNHKYRIMRKLGICDRVELARFAIREGLIPP